jgi:uncharacterized membrane protein
MKMKQRTTLVILIVAVVMAAAASFVVYDQLPPNPATHWNMQGEADGFGTRFEAAFLLPIILFAAGLMLVYLPYLDPLRRNIEQFKAAYYQFIVIFILFFLVVHGMVLGSNLGLKINLTRLIAPAVGLLYFFIGGLMKHAKRNYMIGIRTPWTLSNDKVWDDTHRLSAKLFRISGVIALAGFFFPTASMWFVIIPAAGVTLAALVYSYIRFIQEENRSE